LAFGSTAPPVAFGTHAPSRFALSTGFSKAQWWALPSFAHFILGRLKESGGSAISSGKPRRPLELSKKISSVADKYGIVYAIVFGSAVEGRYIEGESDVDIAVKLEKIDKSGVYSFFKSFTSDLDLDNVDVVIVNFAPFSLVFDILSRGRVIFCKDELFENRLKAIKMYDDWLNFSRYFIEREVKKVMRRGKHSEEVSCASKEKDGVAIK